MGLRPLLPTLFVLFGCITDTGWESADFELSADDTSLVEVTVTSNVNAPIFAAVRTSKGISVRNEVFQPNVSRATVTMAAVAAGELVFTDPKGTGIYKITLEGGEAQQDGVARRFRPNSTGVVRIVEDSSYKLNIRVDGPLRKLAKVEVTATSKAAIDVRPAVLHNGHVEVLPGAVSRGKTVSLTLTDVPHGKLIFVTADGKQAVDANLVSGKITKPGKRRAQVSVLSAKPKARPLIEYDHTYELTVEISANAPHAIVDADY